MMFKLTALTSEGQWRNFNFHQSDLEVTYNVLQNIVQKGDTLLEVTLIDECGNLAVPLNDLGEPGFLNPIGVLRQQWETLLF